MRRRGANSADGRRTGRIHAVHPRYGNTCVNDTVSVYFADDRLPSRDLICRR
ncbi:hypothetical protein [Streptomyces sp. NPDC057496]|uniref:hypothetical protein n=1 Tax=Streptomyces sp. NPDC057496 TaxID=3346149 RepID=UPI0036C2CD40